MCAQLALHKVLWQLSAIDGWLKVEVLDENGQVIPGYEEASCNPLTGDSVDAVVTWAGHTELPDVQGLIQLRFILKNARLYSFQAGDAVDIAEPPTIQKHPSDQDVGLGGTAIFTVTATGPSPLSYQWQMHGVNLSDGGHISGATTDTLVVSDCQISDIGDYRCIVTNAFGQDTSNVATLAVAKIIPEDFIVESRSGGKNFTNYSETGTWNNSVAKSTAEGCTPGIGSRWRFISSSPGKAIFSFSPTVSGTYEVFTTNATTVNSGNPMIHKVSHNGGTTTVQVCQNSGCTPNPCNVWRSLGQYTLTGGMTYTVELDGSLGAGSHPNDNAGRSDAIRWLAIDTGDRTPFVTENPISQSIAFGRDASFTVQAGGDEPLSYQWQKNNVDITDDGPYSGTTTPTLDITSATFDEAGIYRCIVINAYGAVVSHPVTLTVRPTISDFDGDGDVDQIDFAYLQRCLGILDVEVTAPACVSADIDGDGNVDLEDVALFLECVSGPAIPAAEHCVN